ncbi:MAG: hypothetical protein A2161_06375 [Candidatus Schekmanbacteria bacterium RBG_13_48_7]|uniref:DUF465 domain-containing protein n=1 Tax=Candidatus Schekmanbacteria bacterium RBG_13_48_7 TaxID=1817878 RepID=A0A1F7S348_9BACT|nr:MAG: hypothetical protein A2161_06375 [Candidatus Schekmanbacteria bacterium RBG_13_48_7]
MSEVELKERLMDTNPDFRKLVEEHRRYDLKIQELTQKTFVTGDLEMEEKLLKRKKLLLKDKIHIMIKNYQKSVETVENGK